MSKEDSSNLLSNGIDHTARTAVGADGVVHRDPTRRIREATERGASSENARQRFFESWRGFFLSPESRWVAIVALGSLPSLIGFIEASFKAYQNVG